MMVKEMKIGFLFSGQGAQFPGMMKEIYQGGSSCPDKKRLGQEDIR